MPRAQRVFKKRKGRFYKRKSMLPNFVQSVSHENLQNGAEPDPNCAKRRQSVSPSPEKNSYSVSACKERWASIRDTFPDTTELRKKAPFTPFIYEGEKTTSHLMPLENSTWSADYTDFPEQASSDQGPSINFPEIKVEVDSFDDQNKTDGNDPTTENGNCDFRYIVPNSVYDMVTDTQANDSKKRTSGELDEDSESAKSKKRQELPSSESEAVTVIEPEYKSPEHPIETFFKSMAATVLTFPPHLMAVAKLNVCRLITELELRALTEKVPFDGSQDRIKELLSESIVGICSTNSVSVGNSREG